MKKKKKCHLDKDLWVEVVLDLENKNHSNCLLGCKDLEENEVRGVIHLYGMASKDDALLRIKVLRNDEQTWFNNNIS